MLAENPRWMRETRSQYPQKMHAGASIILIDGNLTIETYLNMIRDVVAPVLANLYPHAMNQSLLKVNVWL